MSELALDVSNRLGAQGISTTVVDPRWVLPVRPGDELTLRTTVREARRSRSKPDRGLVRTQVELLNQSGDVVLSMLAMNLIRTRPT